MVCLHSGAGNTTCSLVFLGHILHGDVDISPLLLKRLRIQGSTLRTRSVEYQTGLITKFVYVVFLSMVSLTCVRVVRFRNDFVEQITGKDGAGPIKTYIHKVYNWHDIKDAHNEIEVNKNMYVVLTVDSVSDADRFVCAAGRLL